MNKFSFLWLLLVSAHMTVFSQISNDDVLFSVGDEPILAQEFIRVYNKNLEIVQDESQKDIDAYLNLFVNYKLKLQEAKSIGLDKKPSYLKELKGYQKQLSKKYLTESRRYLNTVMSVKGRSKGENNIVQSRRNNFVPVPFSWV